MSSVENEPKETQEDQKGTTRREFLKGAAVGAAAAATGALAGCAPTPTPQVITEVVEVVKEVPVEVIKEVPVEVTKIVEKEVPVEVIKEVPVEVTKIVEKEVPVEVVKEVSVELQQAIGHIERNVEACSGCRTCEAVCTLSHDGVVSPALARTWIVYYIMESRIEGYTCKQCEGPECLYACPVEGALYIDEATGARVIDPEKCIGCELCLEACPQYPNSPIRYDAQREICVKCDLCDGDPLCVKFCPESALSLKKEV